jgi:hypothetical protein
VRLRREVAGISGPIGRHGRKRGVGPVRQRRAAHEGRLERGVAHEALNGDDFVV